jgi:hypothetical protein
MPDTTIGRLEMKQLFKYTFCATDFRIHMIIGQSDRVTASVETFQDLGQGADCGSARDELSHPIPWRSHMDQPQLRNLEKLYTQDSNYAANIANEGCVGVRQYNIIQDCL